MDLPEAVQDLLAPDLNSMVPGLTDMKGSIALLRNERKAANARLRDEIAAVERQSVERLDAFKRWSAERLESSELRTAERIACVYGKIENVGLKRRLEQVTREDEFLTGRAEPKQ